MSITRRGFLRGALATLAAVITGRKVTVASEPTQEGGWLPDGKTPDDYFYKGGYRGPEVVSLYDREASCVKSGCGDLVCTRDCYFFCDIRDGPRGEEGEPELMILPGPSI